MPVPRRKTRSPLRRKLVAKAGELAHGTSKKFTLQCSGATVEAMLINYEGGLYAFVNRCRHIGISLDWVDNRFFTDDSRYLLCANHGATYEPKTGLCIWGPCAGEYLHRVPLEFEDDRVYARCPEYAD
jgi:nitrite reductase/ring-hydroxylating ferredoxin subunit